MVLSKVYSTVEFYMNSVLGFTFKFMDSTVLIHPLSMSITSVKVVLSSFFMHDQQVSLVVGSLDLVSLFTLGVLEEIYISKALVVPTVIMQ